MLISRLMMIKSVMLVMMTDAYDTENNDSGSGRSDNGDEDDDKITMRNANGCKDLDVNSHYGNVDV